MHQCLILSVQLKDFFAKKKKNFIVPKSDHCPGLSVYGALVEFCSSNFWICQSCYMDLSK